MKDESKGGQIYGQISGVMEERMDCWMEQINDSDRLGYDGRVKKMNG